MKFQIPQKKESIVVITIILVFILYFTAIIYFSFKVETIVLFQKISKNNILLYLLLFLFLIMFALVLYYIIQIVADRIKKREGSKFRLRLTLFFLIITSIPLIPLTLISNNWISKSINMWFVGGIEDSLVDAVEVTKELYNRLAEESTNEWKDLCGDCPYDSIKDIRFKRLDGVYLIDPEKSDLIDLFSSSGSIRSDIATFDISDLKLDTWKRVNIKGNEYLFIPVQNMVLVKKIPDFIKEYTISISTGLQNYRTLKIIREPIKGIVILFYIVVTMPFVLLAFYLGLIISRDVTIPIRELAIATQKVANGELDYKVEFAAKDELKLLIDSFNKMTEDLRLNKELLRYSERSAAWQDIARKIAHEIKNPLTPIKLSAERILKLYKGDDDYKEVLSKGIETIIKEVNNITYMVNEFSSFARFPSSRLERHDIIAIMEEIYNFLKHTYKNIQFSISHKEKGVYILVDRYQMRRAFLNIIYNSIDAVPAGGQIWIEGYTSRGKNNHYTISISDNGAGIDEEIKDKIFNPYFSKDGKSTGLCLAIVEKIVFDNKGRIWFESIPGRTTFFMEFLKA